MLIEFIGVVNMKVIIFGVGLFGVVLVWYLVEDGYEVMVFDC